MGWLLRVPIENPWFFVPLYAAAAALILYLLWRTVPRSGAGAVSRTRRLHRSTRVAPGRVAWTVGAAVAGGVLGLGACWLLGDVWDVFGIQLTLVTRLWVAAAFAGVAAALVNLVGSRWWRVLVACAAIPVFVLAGAVGVNVNFGAYPTVADAMGVSSYRPLHEPHAFHAIGASADAPVVADAGTGSRNLLATWRSHVRLPKEGRVGQVVIPGVRSHFHARPAFVYLPPAALVPDAPALPVIYALSGQPGNPQNMFTSGHIQTILNGYARTHHGLAPIVVAPDQLGSPSQNPMCANSRLGNVATYLTADVPAWIHDHLDAAAPGPAWGIVGFSEGGTCAMQFATGDPGMFDTVIDVSGEVVPTIGADTARVAFGGSQRAYQAIQPLHIMAAHGAYPHTTVMFAVGQLDAKYTARMHVMDAAATGAGMHTTALVSPGTAHDWNTVRYALTRDVPRMATLLLEHA